LAPSEQLAVVHLRLEQSVLTQSVPAAQVFVPPQRRHPVAPPQSTSVSAPLRTLSLHDGTAQIPPLQTPLWQSEPCTQSFESAQ
jgi:hypothetical protein